MPKTTINTDYKIVSTLQEMSVERFKNVQTKPKQYELMLAFTRKEMDKYYKEKTNKFSRGWDRASDKEKTKRIINSAVLMQKVGKNKDIVSGVEKKFQEEEDLFNAEQIVVAYFIELIF